MTPSPQNMTADVEAWILCCIHPGVFTFR